MIEYVKGDLFAGDHPVIAHGVNCQGVMGSGVAKLVKEKYPEVYKSYKELCDRYSEKSWMMRPLLGGIQLVPIINGPVVINCFTQNKYGSGKQVSYDAVDSCFKDIAVYLEDTDEYLAIPKIGAGLGGGEWSIIEAIIKHHLKDVHVKVYEL